MCWEGVRELTRGLGTTADCGHFTDGAAIPEATSLYSQLHCLSKPQHFSQKKKKGLSKFKAQIPSTRCPQLCCPTSQQFLTPQVHRTFKWALLPQLLDLLCIFPPGETRAVLWVLYQALNWRKVLQTVCFPILRLPLLSRHCHLQPICTANCTVTGLSSCPELK